MHMLRVIYGPPAECNTRGLGECTTLLHSAYTRVGVLASSRLWIRRSSSALNFTFLLPLIQIGFAQNLRKSEPLWSNHVNLVDFHCLIYSYIIIKRLIFFHRQSWCTCGQSCRRPRRNSCLRRETWKMCFLSCTTRICSWQPPGEILRLSTRPASRKSLWVHITHHSSGFRTHTTDVNLGQAHCLPVRPPTPNFLTGNHQK